MNLRIECKSAGTQGKSCWVLIANIDGKDKEVARSPHNYGTVKNCRKGAELLKKAIAQSIVHIDVVEWAEN